MKASEQYDKFKKEVNSVLPTITDNECWDMFITLGGALMLNTKEMSDSIKNVLNYKFKKL